MMTPADFAAAATRAAALLAHDPKAAGREAGALLRVAPADPRARLIMASALRRLGDPDAAHAILAPLARAYPNAARTQYELGLTALAMGQHAAGLRALRRAVQISPDLTEAWQALGDHLFRTGDRAGADLAFAELERHAITNPALRGAADALFAGDLDRAETLLVAHLGKSANDFEALRMLGELRLKRGQLPEAETLLGHCVTLDPTHDGARFSHALVLFKRQSGEAALAQLAPLLAKDPAHAAYRNLHAAALALVGRHDLALVVYEALLAEYPHHPQIWLNYGHALRTVRRRDDAIAAYRQAIAFAPAMGEAYWSLANLKTVALNDDEIAAMTSQLARADVSDDDRLHLHYALGKSFEDAQDFARSFEHYAKGAQIRFAQQPCDVAAEMQTQRIKAVCTPALFRNAGQSGCASDAPIFVLGLPRSGSTLVEQILASHSSVEGTMELPDIAALAEQIGGFPEGLAALTVADGQRLGESYLRRTAVHRTSGRAHFIDKMPNNFRFIGLIARILPRAKIIDVRRHPMAACFSGFKQHFAAGHAWSYDLATVGQYYCEYVELMRHFDTVLPGRIHRVIYEDLVESTEAEVRRMLDYARLPFEPGCLEFHRNDRAVRTVSSEQVRRPIFRDGLNQWHHYQPWLGPLEQALEPVLDDWRR
jgi:tetratricopeptide (TPR) repeat protein